MSAPVRNGCGELFALEFMEWIGEIVNTKGIHLAVDGKALRATMEKVKDFRATMVLNVIDAVTGVVVVQRIHGMQPSDKDNSWSVDIA